MSHVLRPARHESGFWSKPPLQMYRCKPAPWLALPPGYEARLEATPNQLEDCTSIRCRELVLRIYDKDRRLVALGAFDILESYEGPFDDDSYDRALDMFCVDTPPDFSTACKLAFGDLASAFDFGRSIANFRWLELLPDSGLKGHGLRIGEAFIKYVTRYYMAAAVFLEPFPLQYKVEEEPAADEVVDEAGFKAGRDKLFELYEQAWDAYRIDDLRAVLSRRAVIVSTETEDDEDGPRFFLHSAR